MAEDTWVVLGVTGYRIQYLVHTVLQGGHLACAELIVIHAAPRSTAQLCCPNAYSASLLINCWQLNLLYLPRACDSCVSFVFLSKMSDFVVAAPPQPYLSTPTAKFPVGYTTFETYFFLPTTQH